METLGQKASFLGLPPAAASRFAHIRKVTEASDSETSDSDSGTPPMTRMRKKPEAVSQTRSATPTHIDMTAKTAALGALFKPRGAPPAPVAAEVPRPSMEATTLASAPSSGVDMVAKKADLLAVFKPRTAPPAPVAAETSGASASLGEAPRPLEEAVAPLSARTSPLESVSSTEAESAEEIPRAVLPSQDAGARASLVAATVVVKATEAVKAAPCDVFPIYEEEPRRGVATLDKRLIAEIKKSKVIDFKNAGEALGALAYLGRIRGSLESEEDLLRYVIYLISAYHYLVSKSMKEETSFPFNLTEFTLSMRWALSKLETRHGVKLFNKKESDTEKLLREPPSTTLYLASAKRHLGDRSHLTPLELASAKNPNMQIFRAMWGQKFPK